MFSFHHVALSVSNIDESLEFYAIFGFKRVGDWEPEDKSFKIVNLRNGDTLLELFSYVNAKSLPEHHKDLLQDLPVVGIKHFGMQVASIDQAKENLQARGLDILHEDTNADRSGANYFFVKDPDGILVEVMEDNRGY